MQGSTRCRRPNKNHLGHGREPGTMASTGGGRYVVGVIGDPKGPLTGAMPVPTPRLLGRRG